MFRHNKRTFRRLTQQAAVIFILFSILIARTDAVAKCHKCDGMNCLRTSYTATEECVDMLDSCVAIFDGSTVLAQGCYGQLAVELRSKCEQAMTNWNDAELAEEGEEDEMLPPVNRECYQCYENMCNNVSGDGFECIQCDSNFEYNCASDIDNSKLKKCPIARSLNSYCYAKFEGKRVMRGCATDLKQQKDCMNNKDCQLCSPLDISGCNRELMPSDGNGTGSGGGGSDGNGTGSGGGGSNGNGTGSGGGGTAGGGGGGGSGGTGGDGGGGSEGGGGGGGGSGGSGGSGSDGDISSANVLSNLKLFTTLVFIFVAKLVM